MKAVVRITAFSLALSLAMLLGVRVGERALSQYTVGAHAVSHTQWRTMTPHGAIESAAGRDVRLRLDRAVMGLNLDNSSLDVPAPLGPFLSRH